MVKDRVRRRPGPDEFFEYYSRYVNFVPDGDIIDILTEQRGTTLDLLKNISEKKGEFRYAPGKWSVKDVIGHVIDVEWIFTYRGLRFARADKTPLAGMEQDEFMEGANFGDRTVSSLAEEYKHLRAAGITLFGSFSDEILSRSGLASGYEFTVRSIVHILAGHERHHVGVLKERYL